MSAKNQISLNSKKTQRLAEKAEQYVLLNEEIKALKERQDMLKVDLLRDLPANVDGSFSIGEFDFSLDKTRSRETIDKAAVIKKFGRKALEQFLKTSVFTHFSVRRSKRNQFDKVS